MSDAQTLEAPPATAPVKGGVAPYLNVGGALKAAEFYARAFGAELAAAHPPDDRGRTMHVHLYINGGSLMLGDAYPEHGHPLLPAQGYTLTICVEDGRAWFDRAVAAGCEVTTPYQRMFWGDDYGAVKDPFGVAWAINAPAR